MNGQFVLYSPQSHQVVQVGPGQMQVQPMMMHAGNAPMASMAQMGQMGQMGPQMMQIMHQSPGSHSHPAYYEWYKETKAAAAKADKVENQMLDGVLGDFSTQLHEATLRVRKHRRHNASQTQVGLYPLKTLEGNVAKGEKLWIGIPKDALHALAYVKSLVALLSAKLVPAMRYERQTPISHVLTIVDTYVQRVASLVGGKEVEEADDADDDDETLRSLRNALKKVNDAMVDIPAKVNTAKNENVMALSAVKLKAASLVALIEAAEK